MWAGVRLTSPFSAIECRDKSDFFGSVQPAISADASTQIASHTAADTFPSAGQHHILKEGKIHDIHPSLVFYAHAFISSAFRNGTKLDALIDAVGIETQMLPDFPPMQVVQYQRIFVAMRGN